MNKTSTTVKELIVEELKKTWKQIIMTQLSALMPVYAIFNHGPEGRGLN